MKVKCYILHIIDLTVDDDDEKATQTESATTTVATQTA